MREPRTLLGALALLAIVAVATYFGSRHVLDSFHQVTLDRDCAQIATWARRSELAVGAYEGLELPPLLRWRAADGKVDVVVLADGRIMLLLRTSLGWRGNWSGVVYCTAPLLPQEMGKDADDRPQINIPGLAQHYVTSQATAQRYNVAHD